MATKKTTAPAEEEALKEEVLTEPEKPEKTADPWAEEMEIIVPRRPKGEDQFYYVCINDRRFQIPANGQVQKLPKPVALILKDSIAAEYAADDQVDEITRKSAEPNPM